MSISQINTKVGQNQTIDKKINILTLLSYRYYRIAHSAAELRILDSRAGLGLDEKDFRRDFLCTSPVSHPRQPVSPQPPLPL